MRTRAPRGSDRVRVGVGSGVGLAQAIVCLRMSKRSRQVRAEPYLTVGQAVATLSFVEEHSGAARALLRNALAQRAPMVAPPLLPSEVASVIRQRMRQGQVQLDEARALLAQLRAIQISLQAPETLHDRALVLAEQHRLPAVSDAHDVALAELLGATLWTADQRLLRALGGRLPFVRWIADYRT